MCGGVVARTRIEYEPKSAEWILQQSLPLLQDVGAQVLAEAESTAVAAEQGSPRLAGYADAGFTLVVEPRGERPRVVVISNAPYELFVRVLVSTAKHLGNGGHLRAALKKFTTRGR